MCCISTLISSIFRFFARSRAAPSRRCTAARICPTFFRSTRLRRYAAGFDLELTAPPGPEGELCRQNPAWPSARLAPPGHRSGAAATLRFSAVLRRRRAPIVPSRSRVRSGIPFKIAAKVDRVDEAYFRDDDRAAAGRPRGRVHRRDQRAAEDAVSRRARRPCCFQSTGLSHSAW